MRSSRALDKYLTQRLNKPSTKHNHIDINPQTNSTSQQRAQGQHLVGVLACPYWMLIEVFWGFQSPCAMIDLFVAGGLQSNEHDLMNGIQMFSPRPTYPFITRGFRPNKQGLTTRVQRSLPGPSQSQATPLISQQEHATKLASDTSRKGMALSPALTREGATCLLWKGSRPWHDEMQQRECMCTGLTKHEGVGHVWPHSCLYGIPYPSV